MKTIEPAILGFCTGDALGVPVEFKSREYLKNNPVTSMIGYGTHRQPAGTWSDDSSMTFCLLDSLIHGYDANDIAKKFIEWYDQNKYTPHGEVFDIGRTTMNALERIQKGKRPVKAGGSSEHDNGNGSLMRILPLAYYLYGFDDDNKFRIIREVSSITHYHIRSVIACSIYVEYAINLLDNTDPLNALDKTRNAIKNFYGNEPELAYFERIMNCDIRTLKETEIKSSGYVVDTLEVALWCLLTSTGYKECVLKAVNLGNDTDTVAAVAGGLAGIHFGIKSIPTEWINALAKIDYILKLCRDFDASGNNNT